MYLFSKELIESCIISDEMAGVFRRYGERFEYTEDNIILIAYRLNGKVMMEFTR